MLEKAAVSFDDDQHGREASRKDGERERLIRRKFEGTGETWSNDGPGARNMEKEQKDSGILEEKERTSRMQQEKVMQIASLILRNLRSVIEL